ncbi:MAG: M42 family metallopeptidase [Nitrospiraceae bacterium]|nr:M42 family metallopeptidase [Nitrospiraceae bacterium]
MQESSLELIRELTEASGISGYEREVREIIRRNLSGITAIEQDGLGSIVCSKRGEAETPRIMLAGHMDEVGFIVKLITDDGFLKFSTVGGWWGHVILAQRVIIKSSGGDFTGVIGSKPPHILSEEERKKLQEPKEMYIDVGATSAEEVRSLGIRPGDPVIPVCPFTELGTGKTFMGKAFDDRAGCALMIDVIKGLVGERHPNTVYAAGTVQEEVGLRGARTSSWVVEPDVGLTMEIAVAGDVPGVKKEEAQARLGKGPVILIQDGSMIPNLKLRDLFIDTAEELKIPYQMDAMERGGTDSGAIHLHRRGVPSLVIGVPTRHIHSHAGIMHREDYEHTVELVKAVVKRLDAVMVARLSE